MEASMKVSAPEGACVTTKAVSSPLSEPCPTSCAVKLSRRHDAVPSRGALIILQTMARKILSAMRADFGQQYSATRYQALLDYMGKTPLYMTLVYVVGVLLSTMPGLFVFAFPYEPVSHGLVGKTYNLLITSSITGMSVIGTIILRFRILHPRSTVTRSQAMCAALMFQAGTLGSIVLLGQWIFPIPFLSSSCGGVGLTLMLFFGHFFILV